jgi:hypothetical protein
VGVSTGYTDVLVRRMDQLCAHPRMASTDRRAYAVHQNEIQDGTTVSLDAYFSKVSVH